MPHFTKPAEGSWTEHYPELGTGTGLLPGLDLAGVLRARARGHLRPHLAERRPGRAAPEGRQLLHEGDRRGAHVDRRRARVRRRDPRLPQHLPPPRQQARVDRLPARGDERHLPAVHVQVPRLALRPRRAVHLRPAGVGVLRPRQERLRPRGRPVRGVGGVHLREPRSREHDVAARVPRRARQGPRGLPVPRADAGPQVPRRGREQLEALHRRVRRVLPRTRPAREAVGGRGVAASSSATATRRWRTGSTVRTAWCRRGVAWRRPRT